MTSTKDRCMWLYSMTDEISSGTCWLVLPFASFFLLLTCLSYHFTLHSHHPCYSPQRHVCRSRFKRCCRQPLLFRITLSRTIFACLVRIHHHVRECSPGWHWAKAPSDPMHPTPSGVFHQMLIIHMLCTIWVESACFSPHGRLWWRSHTRLVWCG